MSAIGKHQNRRAAPPGAAEGPPLADEVVVDPAVVGLPAVVTIRIAGRDLPGEVQLHVRGTYENFIAYAVEPLEVGRHVEVVSSRGGRAVDVDPTTRGT